MTRARWRWSAAVCEGFATVAHGRWLSAALAAVAVLACATPAVLDAHAVTGIVADEAAWVRAGGRTFLVDNPTAGSIDRAACERFDGLDGVHGAGALSRFEQGGSPVSGPANNLTLVGATPGVWRLLGLDPGPADVVVPPKIAHDAGWRTGAHVVLEPSGGLVVAGSAPPAPGLIPAGTPLPSHPLRIVVADTSVLGEEYSGLLVSIWAQGPATACVVQTDASHLAVRDAVAAALSNPAAPARVSDRLYNGDFTVDFSHEYARRPLQWGFALGGCIMALVWFLAAWMRRDDEALYVTLGADRATRAVIRGTEWLLTALVGGLAGLTLAILAALALDVPHALVIEWAWRGTLGTLTVASALVALGLVLLSRSHLEALKER